MSHPNEELIRRLFDLFMRGDRQEAVRLFTNDAALAYPSPGPLQGEHRGHAGILSFWSNQDRFSGDAFRPELADLVAGDRHVFLLVRVVPDDGRIPWMRGVAYEIRDGRIAGARVFEDDPEAAEAFFSRGGDLLEASPDDRGTLLPGSGAPGVRDLRIPVGSIEKLSY